MYIYKCVYECTCGVCVCTNSECEYDIVHVRLCVHGYVQTCVCLCTCVHVCVCEWYVLVGV